MKCINLIDEFDREIEVLEITDTAMIYAIDRKNEVMDMCHIGRYDFESGEKQQLTALDYTRLYESFQTYGQSKDYFYAMNVLQDYRLRLRRISKKTWAPEGELLVDALGEILSLFIIDEQYLLIIDEVKKTDEFLDMYKMADDGSAYMNLCYLYDCYSRKRYPVTDQRLHGFVETVKVCGEAGDSLVIGIHHGSDMETERQYTSNMPLSAVYVADKQAFINAVTNRRPMYLAEVCVSDEHRAVRFFENDNDDIVCRVRDFDERTEMLVSYDLENDEKTVLFKYPYKENGTYFYDSWNYQVYYEEDYDVEDMTQDSDACQKQVICVTDPNRSFSYSSRFGEFSGLCREQMFLTTFYKEVMVKEYEYHEYVAVHTLAEKESMNENGFEEGRCAQERPEAKESPMICEGRFTAHKDKVILLKTFLAL